MNLFAYGTLMDEEIMARASGCRPDRRPATLADHRRQALIGKTYPAIIRQAGAEVEGVCYLDLPAAAWLTLDLFEDEIYQRVPVRVTTGAGLSLAAETYLCRPQFHHLLAERDWSLANFLKSHKAKFQAEYSGFEERG